MHAETPSRVDTLADLILAMSQIEDTPKRLQEIVSAVRTVARAMRRDPCDIPADHRALAARLAKISHQQAGVSRGRWANVQSLLRQGLGLVRPLLPSRSKVALSAGWNELFKKLPSKAHRVRLSRLLRWLSSRDISPEAVSEDLLNEFHRLLLHDSHLTKPEDAWAATGWAWNNARKRVAGWPALWIHLPCRRKSFTFPWNAFPKTLEVDVGAWLKRIGREDPLDPLPFDPVSVSTLRTREWQLRAVASALVHQGVPPESIISLRDLVQVDAVKRGLRFFWERKNGASSHLQGIGAALQAVARHHVKLSTEELNAIAGIVRRVSPTESGMSQKNRTRLRQFDDETNVQRLLTVPQLLMRQALGKKGSARNRALLAQTAVAIEFLIVRPLRIKNLHALDLDKSFISPSRACAEIHVIVPADEVKNGVCLEHTLPPESARLLELYVRKFRPLLTRVRTNTALFPGNTATGQKSVASLRKQIAGAILRHTGLEVNPHLFRQGWWL